MAKLIMTSRARRGRAKKVLPLLDELFPAPRCELNYKTPFQLLAATILSAQCTDKRVNMVTPDLFNQYPTISSLADAAQEDVEVVVHSTGFFRNKAKNIIGAATGCVENFGGEVPQTMEELLTLPGVARKTANVVLGECFGIADGLVVDTHVIRIGSLLGLHDGGTNAVRIERELMEVIPEENWIRFSHQIILHGRATCIARRPQCDSCLLASVCPSS